MSIEEKTKLAQSIYSKMGIETSEFDIDEINEIEAHVFYPKIEQKGTNGVIVTNDGRYYICGSIYPLSYYINEIKKERENK